MKMWAWKILDRLRTWMVQRHMAARKINRVSKACQRLNPSTEAEENNILFIRRNKIN